MAPKKTLYWLLCALAFTVLVDSLPASAATKSRRRSRTVAKQSAWLESRSAIVLDAKTGEALFERRPDEHMYPASTTKILTAIVAIESGKMDETVTIRRSDVQVQPSIIGLRAGERIKLRDLVYGLMLRSGNDAALAIARHVGGTRSNFYEMMNLKARSIGCKETHFTNPHGLPDRNHYTTARDLGRIMVYAMKNEDFRAITSSKRYVSKSSFGTRTMVNKNKLLRLYPGTTGGKPGYTRAAQQTLVAAASRRDRELVVVCLHSVGKALWSDATHLFDFGFDRLGLTHTSRGAIDASSAVSAP